jgi:hypothetical protein
MREEIESRLAELRREFEFGQKQHAQLSETLIRISGAIQVLEELLTNEPERDNGSVSADVLVGAS